MEKYKGLHVPKLYDNQKSFKAVQVVLCVNADCQNADFQNIRRITCEDCLFFKENFQSFKEWYEKEVNNG